MSAPDQPPATGAERRSPRLRRLRLPRYTIRLRLALLYGGVFSITGTVLLAIIFLTVRYSTHGVVVSAQGAAARVVELHVHGAPPPGSTLSVTPESLARAQAQKLGAVVGNVNTSDLHHLLILSLFALAIMVVASMALGWVLAGRVLRPLQLITTTARELSASNLHERLALGGPNDELRELGDTFDELLGRLESSFESQRQFVANASHELRTPLTLERAILEVTLADPAASSSSLRAACERVLAIGEQQERLIDALLALARSEGGLERREPVDLGSLTEAVLSERRTEIARRALRLEAQLGEAPTTGDPRLLERLVANLLDNAVRHNMAGGWIAVTSGTEGGETVLTVANSGPLIAPQEIERLLEPFHRQGADRLGHGDGHGLGLSIIAAIAKAHDAKLSVQPQDEGGLRVRLRFGTGGS